MGLAPERSIKDEEKEGQGLQDYLRVVSIVRSVKEVDVVVLVLVRVASPAVKHVSSIRVQVDKPTNSRVCIQDPLDGLCLGLRECLCS